MVITRQFFNLIRENPIFKDMSFLIDDKNRKDRNIYIELIYKSTELIGFKELYGETLFQRADGSYVQRNDEGSLMIVGFGKCRELSNYQILIIEKE